jgi:hypothetical protein
MNASQEWILVSMDVFRVKLDKMNVAWHSSLERVMPK